MGFDPNYRVCPDCGYDPPDHNFDCGLVGEFGGGLVVLICGGRDFADRDFAFEQLDAIDWDRGGITKVVHGACGWDRGRKSGWLESRLKGGDRWADEWTLARGRQLARYPADWTSHGKRAGFLRNAEMLAAEPDVDLVIALPGGNGTADMMRQARIRGVEVIDLSQGAYEARNTGESEMRTPKVETSATHVVRRKEAGDLLGVEPTPDLPDLIALAPGSGEYAVEVEIAMGHTVNMGNYESLRTDVRIKAPVAYDADSIVKAADIMAAWVEGRLGQLDEEAKEAFAR